MIQTAQPPLKPSEGMVVCHLFFSFDRLTWSELEMADRQARSAQFQRTVSEVRALPSTQLLTLSMVSQPADIGFMLVTGDLQLADVICKQLAGALGPGVLTLTDSYLSLTEQTEYVTSEEEQAANLARSGKWQMGSPEFEAEMAAWKKRMEKYMAEKLRPQLSDWPIFCFYPMLKRREAPKNWYALPFDKRKQLMAGHARVGREWAGRVQRLVTGSTGLDAMEWGVTLFAHDLAAIKGIVYEMRFDEVSTDYAEFGDFQIGLQLSPEEILRRLGA